MEGQRKSDWKNILIAELTTIIIGLVWALWYSLK